MDNNERITYRVKKIFNIYVVSEQGGARRAEGGEPLDVKEEGGGSRSAGPGECASRTTQTEISSCPWGRGGQIYRAEHHSNNVRTR